MSFIVDQFGTRTRSFSVYDSDSVLGYRQGDSIIRNGIVYVATTDIPGGVPFTLADSEGDAQKWLARVTGAEAAKISTLSDVALLGLKNGDTLVWDSDSERWKPGAGSAVGKINDLTDVDTATTPPKHLSNLFYDSDAKNWIPQTLRNKEESFVIDSETAGTNEFTLTETPHEVTHFFRNGMRIVKAAWVQSDSDAVYYLAAQNGNSPMALGDEIQITYNTISE